jgi:hypothetical protein
VRYIGNDRVFARHALFATRYLAPRFPNLNVSFDYATVNGGPTMNDVALGLLSPRAQACDGFVGPQWSSVSVGISALITKPWVSHTATSTSLSDKAIHPWFSRMLPTDDFGGAGMAAVATAFGWKYASVICVDDAYGQSLLSGFRKQHVANGGGVIEASPCILNDASDADVRAAVQQVRDQARGKVVMLAGSASSAILGKVVDAILGLGMQRTHVFVFSESACGLRWARLGELPGSFCVSYLETPAVTAPYAAAWAGLDHAATFAHLDALGIPAPANPAAAPGLFAYLVHDCVLSLLSAFNGTALPSESTQAQRSAAVLDTLRAQTVAAGATGPITMDARGDRVGALLSIKNVVPVAAAVDGFELEAYATWSPSTGVAVVDARERYWLAAGRGAPPDVQPPEEDTVAAPSTVLLAGLLVAIVVISIVVGCVIKLGCSDASVVAKVFHCGAAGSATIAVFDVADLVLSVFAALDVLGNPGQYSAAFRVAFAALCAVATVGGVIDLCVIGLFLKRMAACDFAPTPGQTAVWRMRLAKGATVSLCLEDLPMLGVTCAALALSNADGRETPTLLLATFIVNSVISGAKLGEPVEILSKAIRKEPVELHNAIHEKFAFVVPLTAKSREKDCRRVYKFIAKTDAMRAYELTSAAKHAVVDMQRDNVSPFEFFSVVWPTMARVMTAVVAMPTLGLPGSVASLTPRSTTVVGGGGSSNITPHSILAGPNSLTLQQIHALTNASPHNNGTNVVSVPSQGSTPQSRTATHHYNNGVGTAASSSSEQRRQPSAVSEAFPESESAGELADDDDFDDDMFVSVRIVNGLAAPVQQPPRNDTALTPRAVHVNMPGNDENASANPLSYAPAPGAEVTENDLLVESALT